MKSEYNPDPKTQPLNTDPLPATHKKMNPYPGPSPKRLLANFLLCVLHSNTVTAAMTVVVFSTHNPEMILIILKNSTYNPILSSNIFKNHAESDSELLILATSALI